MSGTKISKLVLGVVLFLILGTLLISTISRGDLVGLAAEGVVTSAPFPTPTLSLTWENVSLDQIHFGEPQVVLTDTLGLRIVGWISDKEVLILRDTKPGGRGSAIEVFNVETRAVRRLAEGRFSGSPVWNPAQRAVVYLQYDEVRRQRDLIWHSLDQEGEKLVSDVVLPILLIDGGKGAAAYSVEEKALIGRLVAPGAQARRLSFAQYAMRIPTPYEWIYRTAVSPDGEWQVVYNYEHFLLVGSEDGTIKEFDLGDWITDGALPRWALEARWSPDGQKLAVIATAGRLPNPVRFLLLLNPRTGTLRQIPVSSPFVIYGLDWSPAGRFLLLSGAISYTEEGYAVIEHRLLDVATGQERKVVLLPNALQGASFAWTSSGKRIIINCTEPGKGALCILSVEVQR